MLWLLGTLGLGGIVLLVLGLTIGSPVLLAFLQTKTGRIGAIAAAVALGVLALMSKERAAGIAAEKKRQENEDADFLNQLNATDAADAQLSDADLDKRLRDNGNTGPR